MKILINKIASNFGLEVSSAKFKPKNTLLGLKGVQVDQIIDVGSNNGQFIKFIRKFFPDSTYFCFEPIIEIYEELKNNIENFKTGEYFAYNLAIGDQIGSVEFYKKEFSDSSSILKSTLEHDTLYPFTKKQSVVTIKVDTLDNFFSSREIKLNNVLIKLDVQGYEDRVIRGGTKTFEKALACIIDLNLLSLYENQANVLEIFELLYSLGFKYSGNIEQFYDGDGKVVYVDALFVRDGVF